MGLTWLTPVEVTPGAASAWTDVDLSASLPVGATGAVFHAVNTGASSFAFGVRKNGSTNDRRNLLTASAHAWAMSGVDANRVCEVYVGHTTNVDVYLVGYTTEGFVFFDNAVDKSLSASAAWTDIDCSTEAPSAVGLLFDVTSGLTRQFGLRKNGSTDDRHFDIGAGLHPAPTVLVGCDNAQIVEGYIETTAVDFWLSGYVTSTAGLTFNTNATDLSIATTGAWTDLATLPAGATGAIVEVTAAAALAFGLRENGSAEDIYADSVYHSWAFIESDAGRIIEGKIESADVDFFLIGYTTAVAAGFAGALASETDTASTGAFPLPGALASESDQALAGTAVSGVVVPGALASESDQALAGSIGIGLDGSLSSEADKAFFGLPVESYTGVGADGTAEGTTAPLELRNAAGTFLRLLPLASNVRVRQKINSLDVLSFDYPREDDSFDDFDTRRIVRFRLQDYRVLTVDDGRSEGKLTGTITAEQYFIALGDTLQQSVELDEVTASAAMSTALSGTGWTVGGADPSGTYSMSDKWKSPLAILFAIANVWNGELQFDAIQKKVYLLEQRGRDAGASLIYRKNIQELTRSRDVSRLYNRVWFEGKDGLTSTRGYVEDAVSVLAHGRSDTFWGDSTITTLKTLVYGATLRLTAYKKPRYRYECTAYNLEPLSGGKSWVTAELGDVVKVYDEDLGINVTTRVYEREWAPFEPDVPDRLVLSSEREWFPDLGEKLAEVLDPTEDSISEQGDTCWGEGGYSWIDANGVPAEWQGSGLPHIWSSYWAYGNAGLPTLVDGQWWAGSNDALVDGELDNGPIGTGGATWEAATSWEPNGFDLDLDGVQDFWPFGRVGWHGVPGGHDYQFDEQPEVWDWADGDTPYLAVDTIPASLWEDVTAYSWWGWDLNDNGVPDSYDTIDTLACPIMFERGKLLLGLDLGGGNIQWDAADPPILPMWHSPARADVLRIVCTGWTWPGKLGGAGQRNFGGPVGYDDDNNGIIDRWEPAGIDTNGDGLADFWPCGDWWAFGYEYGSTQPIQVGTCGAEPPTVGPVAPDLPPDERLIGIPNVYLFVDQDVREELPAGSKSYFVIHKGPAPSGATSLRVDVRITNNSGYRSLNCDLEIINNLDDSVMGSETGQLVPAASYHEYVGSFSLSAITLQDVLLSLISSNISAFSDVMIITRATWTLSQS